jgi:hypothetical protein
MDIVYSGSIYIYTVCSLIVLLLFFIGGFSTFKIHFKGKIYGTISLKDIIIFIYYNISLYMNFCFF